MVTSAKKECPLGSFKTQGVERSRTEMAGCKEKGKMV